MLGPILTGCLGCSLLISDFFPTFVNQDCNSQADENPLKNFNQYRVRIGSSTSSGNWISGYSRYEKECHEHRGAPNTNSVPCSSPALYHRNDPKDLRDSSNEKQYALIHVEAENIGR